MRRPAQKEFVLEDSKHGNGCLRTLTVGIAVIMLIAGCGEQNLSNTRKCRLIANENRRLKKQLEQRDTEIEKQKELHAAEMGKQKRLNAGEIEKQQKLHYKEIEKQEELLEKCLQEKEGWKEMSQKGIQEQVSSILRVVMDQNAKLREENSKLKAQIEKLKKELEQRRGKPGPQPL